METSPFVLELEGVAVGYPGKDRAALTGLNLSVRRGEIIGVTGVSGSGKTTLLRTCARLLAPLQGRMTLGSDAQRLAYSPQEDILLEYRNVWENAALLMERKLSAGAGWPVARIRLEDCLSRVGLISRRREMPSQLSGGMRQRLQVVQAVCAGEQLLLLDEPFAQQDRDNQRKLEDLIVQAAGPKGAAILVVSHDIDTLSAICDRILFLGGSPGQVLAEVRVPPRLASGGATARRKSPAFAVFSRALWSKRAEVALA